MITVEKISNGRDYDIQLKYENKIFTISRMSDDVRLSCRYNTYTKLSSPSISFTVSEEDCELYAIFERLYQNIIDGNVIDMDNTQMQRYAESIKSYSWYDEVVSSDGTITITCDDYRPEVADTLKIRKEPGKIVLEFTRINDNGYGLKSPFEIAILVRTQQSHAHELALPFYNTLFRRLQGIAATNDTKQLINLPRKNNTSEIPK